MNTGSAGLASGINGCGSLLAIVWLLTTVFVMAAKMNLGCRWR